MKKNPSVQWLVPLALLVFSAAAQAVDQTKADNATALDQAASWVGNAVPGQTDRAIWDGTLSAVNCTNTAGNSTLNMGQIQIKSPTGGVPVSITGSSAWWRLYGVSGAVIDMSAATVDLNVGSGFTIQSQNTGVFFTNQTGRTLTISGTLFVGSSAGNSLILDGGGNYVFSGSLTGAGTRGGTLIKQGGGAVTIKTPNYNTNFVINAGTVNLDQNFAINGYANSTMTINGGTIDNTSGGAIALTANPPSYFWNGDFIFAGTGSLNLGGGTVSLSGNRQVTCNANTLTVGGAIGDGGSAYSLTKAGAGTLTLSGASAYSGNTFISAGTLALSGGGSIPNSPSISVASGAAFDVSGLSAALTFGASQTLRATATGVNTTATIKGAASRGLALSAGGIVFTAYGGGATAPLTASAAAGAVNLNGAPITVTTTTALTPGTYTLIDTASSGTVTGTPGTLTVNGSGLAANTIASLAVTSSKLILTVTATAQVKADNATSLELGGSWVSGSAPGSLSWAIWNGAYTPANLTNAFSGSVTWGGIVVSNVTGAAGATVSITNNGGNTLSLNGVGGLGIDMSAAAVDLNLSTLRVYVNGANQVWSVAGSRTLTIANNLQLKNNLTLTNGGNYIFPSTVTVWQETMPNPILTMSGTGTMTVAGLIRSTNTVLNSGTLVINNQFALQATANSMFTINGGTLDSTVGVTLHPANALLQFWNGDFAFTGTQNLGFGAGAVTLGGNRQVTCNANTLTVGGVIGDGGSGYSLAKAGAGTLTLTGANTYGGNTIISAGTLALSGSGSITNSASIVVASNAILNLSGLSSAFTLASSLASQTLSNSAPGAILNGTNKSSGGTLSLKYDGVNPSFIITNGGMTLSAATSFRVNNTTTQLPHGTNKLIARATTGNVGLVAGALPAVTVSGGGAAAPVSLQIVSGELYLNVNNPPVANAKIYSVAQGGIITIVVASGSKSLATDVDGDTLTVTSLGDTNAVDFGTAGISGGGAGITYTNTSGAAGSFDVFSYTVTDGYGGRATNSVSIRIDPATGANLVSAAAGGGNAYLTYAGIPGTNYALDWATNVMYPINWTQVQVKPAETNGVLRFTNLLSSYPTNDFFRTRYVP